MKPDIHTIQTLINYKRNGSNSYQIMKRENKMKSTIAQKQDSHSHTVHSNCAFKKRTASIFFYSPTQCPIRCSGWEMKMPLFLQAAPGMSLGEEFDALYKRLELSSVVKVKTHQFSSKFHLVLDSSVHGSSSGSGPIGLGL